MGNLSRQSIRKLPIYRLATPQFSDTHLERLATRAFGMDSYAAERIPDGVRLTAATRLLEVNLKTGAMWMADQSQLWNPDMKPRLPKPEETELRVRRYLQEHDLLPQSTGGMDLKVEHVSTAGTHLSTFDVSSKRRHNRQLDVHESFGVEVTVPSPEGDSRNHVPILAGIGKIGVTLGNQGQVIAYHREWRDAD